MGKKVMVLVNLKPAKLAGVLSEGMLLCAEDEEGKLSLVVPEKDMPAGAEICRYIYSGTSRDYLTTDPGQLC